MAVSDGKGLKRTATGWGGWRCSGAPVPTPWTGSHEPCPGPARPGPGGALPADKQPSGGSGPAHVLSRDLGCPRRRCPSRGRSWLAAGCLQVLTGGAVGLQGCVFCLCRPRALQGHRPVHEALMDASLQPGSPRSEPNACSKPHDLGAAQGRPPGARSQAPRHS